MRQSFSSAILIALFSIIACTSLWAQDYPQLFFLSGYRRASEGGWMWGPDWVETERREYYSVNADPLNINEIHRRYYFRSEIDFQLDDYNFPFNGSVEYYPEYFLVRSPGQFLIQQPSYRISKIDYNGYYLEDCLTEHLSGYSFYLKAWFTYNETMKQTGSIIKYTAPTRWEKTEIILNAEGNRSDEYHYQSTDSLAWSPFRHIQYIYSGEQFSHGYQFEKHSLYMPHYIVGIHPLVPPYLSDTHIISQINLRYVDSEGDWGDPEVYIMNPVCLTDWVILDNFPIYETRITYTNQGLLNSFADYGGDPSMTYTFTYAHTSQSSAGEDHILQPQALRIYPNPVKEIGSIEYSFPKASSLVLKTYNLKGQLLKQESFAHAPAKGSLIWRAEDSNKKPLSKGLYIINMQSDGFKHSLRVLVQK